MAMDLTAAMVTPIMEVLYVPLLLIALALAWSAGVSPPVLLACLVLFYRLLPKFQHFHRARVQLAGLLGAVDNITALLRTDDKPYLSSGSRRFERLERGIEFQDVEYRYAPRSVDASDSVENHAERPTVQGLNFTIERGQMLAIVGGSGAGKSTIVNLLCRFYDPQKGRILVDGVPLPALETKSWRSRVAITGQDADLVSGTIAENISYGCPDATAESIERAARRAEVHDFIVALPDGYATQIGSRGRSLSEGQRQRVSLARALLTDPCVLVLDEAMNALDNVTAAAVAATLEALRGELTIVIIAHRLDSVRHADNILVLKDGRIVERGTRAALLADDGVFARLYALERNGKGLGESDNG
jgi:ABC-type multidrug transport system fused ATPase/permease subunit